MTQPGAVQEMQHIVSAYRRGAMGARESMQRLMALGLSDVSAVHALVFMRIESEDQR